MSPGGGNQQHTGHHGEERNDQRTDLGCGERIKLTKEQSSPHKGDHDVQRSPRPLQSLERCLSSMLCTGLAEAHRRGGLDHLAPIRAPTPNLEVPI